MKDGSEKLRAVLKGGKILVFKKDNPYWRAYVSNGYGVEREDFIELDIVEALHLLEKKKIIIKHEKKNSRVGKEELFKMASKNNDFWLKYLLYKDLRNRGYTVTLAEQKPIFLHIYDRGVKDVRKENPIYSILPAEAARELKVGDLHEAIKLTKQLGTSLIIGIVDELGEVVYYNVIEEVLEKKGEI